MKSTSLILALFLLTVVAGGCGGSKKGTKIDYEATRTLPPLEVPPDLSSLPPDSHTSRTGTAGAATYSAFEAERKQQGGGTQHAGLLPQYDNIRLVRAGAQQWLVVKAAPDQLWPLLRDFVDKMGLTIAKEEPAAGIIETNWAENRALAGGGVSRFFSKITGQGAGTGLRDKYRIRLERAEEPGSTEIFMSHRGLQSVIVYDTGPVDVSGRELEGHSAWKPRPSDPDLEAEMLRRLMVHLGTSRPKADTITAAVETSIKPKLARAKLIRAENGHSYLALADGRERAWRRVGLSLDRIGFTVEERDHSNWTYYVRYIIPDETSRKKKKKKKRKKREEQDIEWRVALKESGVGTTVEVLNQEGVPDASKTSEQILGLLYEQLK